VVTATFQLVLMIEAGTDWLEQATIVGDRRHGYLDLGRHQTLCPLRRPPVVASGVLHSP
jgi:hypothetical protein